MPEAKSPSLVDCAVAPHVLCLFVWQEIRITCALFDPHALQVYLARLRLLLSRLCHNAYDSKHMNHSTFVIHGVPLLSYVGLDVQGTQETQGTSKP